MLNVSSKPLLRVDTGNLSETCGMSNAENKCLSVGYQLTHTVRWRTSSNGTKAYPTIHIPTHYVNWGLPKTERQMAMCNAER